jgi:hypothetical protein
MFGAKDCAGQGAFLGGLHNETGATWMSEFLYL